MPHTHAGEHIGEHWPRHGLRQHARRVDLQRIVQLPDEQHPDFREVGMIDHFALLLRVPEAARCVSFRVGRIRRPPRRYVGEIIVKRPTHGDWRERLAKHAVDVHRPCGRAHCDVPCLVCRREYKSRGRVRRRAGECRLPPDIVGKDPGLLYGLVRAGLQELRRAIGGEQQQRHIGCGRLHHGGEIVGHGAARGADKGHGTHPRARKSQCKKSRAAFIEMDVCL